MLWKTALKIKKKEGENLNRKIKKYLDEIEKTEKKIADLEMYLKGVRSALKEEENNEMIKSITSFLFSFFHFTIFIFLTFSFFFLNNKGARFFF